MVLFDFEKIWLLSLGQPHLILRYFKYLYLGYYDYRSLRGTNFILNPEIVINNPYKLSQQQLAEYLGICALRNYANYQQTGDADLELEYFPPWVPRQVVDTNPLFAIKQTKLIYLKENNL